MTQMQISYLKFLVWQNLTKQRLSHVAIMVFKSLKHLTPDYLQSKFIPRNDLIYYSLRNVENKLAIPLPQTNYGKRCFSYRGAVLWNNLPIDITNISTWPQFKNSLRCYDFPLNAN